MKRILIISALTTLAPLAQAEIQFIPEVLAGQSINLIRSTAHDGDRATIYKNSLNATSYGLRLGVKFSEHFSIEFGKHYHGEITDRKEIRYPSCISGHGGSSCLGEDQDYIITSNTPIDTESLRLGIKGELEIYKDIFINSGIGIAHWQYNKYKPIELIRAGGNHLDEKSGNDIYFSLGSNYKVTNNIFIGLEYSLLTISQKLTFAEAVYVKGTHHINDLSLTASWRF